SMTATRAAPASPSWASRPVAATWRQPWTSSPPARATPAARRACSRPNAGTGTNRWTRPAPPRCWASSSLVLRPPAEGVEGNEEGEDDVGRGCHLRDPVQAVGGGGHERHADHRRDQEEPQAAVGHENSLTAWETVQAMRKAPGMVTIHAHTTWLATP